MYLLTLGAILAEGGIASAAQAGASNRTRSLNHAAPQALSASPPAMASMAASGLVDVRWVRVPRAVVEVDEHDQRSPRSPFVAVGEGMVPCQPTDEDGGLVVHVGVELDVAEPGLRSMQRRLGQLLTRFFRERLGLDACDLLGQPEVLGQREVSGHWARRSNNSRSRSRSRLARLVKSSSCRTRSISALRASMIRALTLVPLTLATASASSARSSGNRTVVCFAMPS